MPAHYLYLGVITFLSGVAVTTFYTLTYPTLVWLSLLSIVALVLYRRLGSGTVSNFWLLIALGLFFFVLGSARLLIANDNSEITNLSRQIGQTVELVGVVGREPEIKLASQHLYVEAEGAGILVSTDKFKGVAYGDKISFSGKLELPESFTTDLGRTFNYPGYLLAKGVLYRVTFAEVEVIESGQGNFIIASLLDAKAKLMQAIEQVLSEPVSGLGEGLLLGVKQALGDDLESAFRRTGIIHIVVLSGYNVMLVVAFVMFVLGSIFPRPVQVVVGILAIIGFALIVGLSSTVVRACLMASLLLLTQLTSRRYLVLRALFFAGAVMVAFNPYLLIYDVGFQLSFMATLGLILAVPVIERFFLWVPDKFSVRTFMLATIATQLTVLPLLLFHMGELSVVAVLVNVLVLPMVPVAMLLTFVTALVGLFSIPLASVLSIPAYFSLAYIIETAVFFAELPFSSVIIPTFPLGLVVLSYALLGLLTYYFYRPGGYVSETVEVRKLKSDNQLERENELEVDLSGWQIEEEFDDDFLDKQAKLKSSPKSQTDLGLDKKAEVPAFFR